MGLVIDILARGYPARQVVAQYDQVGVDDMNALPSAQRMRFTQRGVPAGGKSMGACPGDEGTASHEYVGDCHVGLESLADKAILLTEYAWKFRYPGEQDLPSREEAAEAVAIAQEVYEGLLTGLPEEVRP